MLMLLIIKAMIIVMLVRLIIITIMKIIKIQKAITVIRDCSIRGCSIIISC